jgi:glycosyltransferase involved in cell wall biosynthesis
LTHKPRTIVFVAWAPFFSGAERALLVLAENLDPARYRPVVIVGTDGELAAELRARHISTVHIPIEYAEFRHVVSWIASVGRFVTLARREDAAIFHANDLPSFQPAGYASKLVRIPSICHIRFPDTGPGFHWFLRPSFSKALFISESLRADGLKQAGDLFEGRSEVVYDGVQVPRHVEDARRQQLREELGLPIDQTLVVLAGQVAEVKGLWDFIEAARILVERRVNVSFVVLGDDLRTKGILREEAERVVRERGLARRVWFLGFRPNAPQLMPAFDIVAIPSHVEPLGLAALEGMAVARPVVGSRVGGIAETVVDGQTGTLVNPRDPEMLANAIADLVLHPDKAIAFGLEGRKRTLERFSIEAHVVRMEAVYDRLLRASP